MRAKTFLSVLLLGVLLIPGARAVPTAPSDNDPYAWLEEVHGQKPLAWVAEQNAKSRGVLKADPGYQKNFDSILEVMDAPDRIPSGSLRRGHVYNFWQDAANPKGLWRRTTIADYRNAAPKWEVLLDVDALAKAEGQNWVFGGANCNPSGKRCLVSLSRGGGDAKVVREFDPDAHQFVKDGFTLPEAKTDVSWWGADRILFATDFGKGSLTESGYARIVKLWARGEPIAAAKTVLEGDVKDVLAASAAFSTSAGDFALALRAVSFFETEYSLVRDDGAVARLPLPLGADVKGMTGGWLLATLRQPWEATAGADIPQQTRRTFPKGALIAFDLAAFAQGKMGAVL